MYFFEMAHLSMLVEHVQYLEMKIAFDQTYLLAMNLDQILLKLFDKN